MATVTSGVMTFRPEPVPGDRGIWFLSLADARGSIEAWMWDYSSVRPHT
jgi:hypothetical protein